MIEKFHRSIIERYFRHHSDRSAELGFGGNKMTVGVTSSEDLQGPR